MSRKPTTLTIVTPEESQEDEDAIRSWLEADSSRATVAWRQDAAFPLTWLADGKNYNMTTLIRSVITQATSEPPRTQMWGPHWYRDSTGRTLQHIAEALS